MVEIQKWTKQIGRVWYLLHRIAAVMWKVLRILHLESKDHEMQSPSNQNLPEIMQLKDHE